MNDEFENDHPLEQNELKEIEEIDNQSIEVEEPQVDEQVIVKHLEDNTDFSFENEIEFDKPDD